MSAAAVRRGVHALGCFSGPKICGGVFGLSRSTPSPGVVPGHGAGCAAGCLAMAGAEEGGWPACRTTLLTNPLTQNMDQSKLQRTPWTALPLPGLRQGPRAAFRTSGCRGISTRARALPPQTLSAVCPPPPPPPCSSPAHHPLFHFRRRESKQRGGCRQEVTHRRPGHAGA